MTDRRGILIAVEGIDGAGKTTQVDLLSRAFDNASEPFVSSKEPTDGKWGKLLRESAQNGRMTLDDELNAFIEDRKEHVANLIQPSLDEGIIVILDRYFYSTIAYQGARGKDVGELDRMMREIAPTPDVVFLVDVDPNVGVSRISNSRLEIPNEFEDAKYLADVRKIFNQLAKSNSEICTIDGHKDIAGVQKAIADYLLDGVIKKKRCAKPWGCSGMLCMYRESGDCSWANLYSALHNNSREVAK